MNSVTKLVFSLLFVSCYHQAVCEDDDGCVKDFFECLINNSTGPKFLDAERTCCERRYNDSHGIFFVTFNHCLGMETMPWMATCSKKGGKQCSEIITLYFIEAFPDYMEFDYQVMQRVPHPASPDECDSFIGQYNNALVEQCRENQDDKLKVFCDLIINAD